MRDIISDTEIHAYLDQQLTPEQAKDFERRLQADPLAQKKLAEYQQIEQSLGQLYQPVYEEPVPPRLLNACKKPTNNYLAIAASGLFFIFGVLSGWQVNLMSDSYDNSLLADLNTPAIFAHSVYSVEKLHPVEVRADEQQHMNHWLSKRLQTPLKAPDLSQHQFELVGGRLLPSTNERMAAQFMYQNRQGDRITLYVKRGDWKKGDTNIKHMSKSIQDNVFNVAYWVEGRLGYVVTGQVDQQVNQKLSESIFRQMSLIGNQLVALL